MARFTLIICVLVSYGLLFSPSLASPGEIITSGLYDQLFPNRNAFYTYDSFLSAAGAFGAFGNTGSSDDQKRELAAFFANVKQETGTLVYIEEINQSNNYCDDRYPCPDGKKFYGRGPLQLSWNYNYQAAGSALGLDLINNPELLATNAVDSFESALWFWMDNANPNTCHDAIRDNGFGATIKIINGGIECGKGTETEQASNRISYYRDICGVLNVDPGQNLSCA